MFYPSVFSNCMQFVVFSISILIRMMLSESRKLLSTSSSLLLLTVSNALDMSSPKIWNLVLYFKAFETIMRCAQTASAVPLLCQKPHCSGRMNCSTTGRVRSKMIIDRTFLVELSSTIGLMLSGMRFFCFGNGMTSP